MAFRLASADGDSTSKRIGSSLSEINIIPLVDVILVLLLIFMLTAPMMYRGIDVNLPKTASKPTAVEERMVLTLTRDQVIYLNERPVPLAGLDSQIRSLMKDRADKTLYLKADQTLAYGFVVETMDRVRRAGVERLGMVTEPTPRER
jgi:biopolymer transport protein TolR